MNDSQENSIVNDEKTTAEKQYFSVGTSKLIIMSLCLGGLYELYWFYKNWIHIKKSDKSDIMPFWRAFFSPLWAYFAFERIQQEANELKLNITLSVGFMAVAYFILHLVSAFPDPYWLISFLSFIPLLPANDAITKINEKKVDNFEQNSKIQGWNWLAIVLGGSVMILSVIATLFMPQI